MRKKDILSFAFESLFNKTFTQSEKGNSLGDIDYLRQTNRLYANLEISTIRYLLSTYKFDYIIDVGANRGQFYKYLRDVIKYRGNIISLEPSAADFSFLSKYTQVDEKFIPINVACGESDGRAFLKIAKDSKLNSFYSSNNFAQDRFVNKINCIDEIEVEVKALKSVLHELKISKTAKLFLKVDTQGHDIEVLKGLDDWLMNVHAIQTELSLISIYEGVPSYYDAIRYINSINFNLYSSVPVTRDKLDRSIIEMNGYFVKRAAKG